MSGYEELLQKIKKKSAKVGIVGLGYVGLPLAILFASKGYNVTGFVRSEKRMDGLNAGNSNLSDPKIDASLKKVLKNNSLEIRVTDKSIISEQDIIVVCVPTPVTHSKVPDLTALKNVASALADVDLNGKLIINESTVAPFTTREVFGSFNGTYFLACSPERIDPGNKRKTTENIPKVLGGINKESWVLAENLYQSVLSEKVITVPSLEAAEMTKMLENTYRAVNIALINEFAKLAEVLGIDIIDVIDAAKTKWSFQAHYPGIGVGGHCIPVDPYYILALAKSRNVSMRVVESGLLENESMPEFLAQKVLKHYKKGMSVLVYGITYKKDVNDVRESPVITFCHLLKDKGVDFTVYDPLISPEEIKKMGFIPGGQKKVDIFIVGTDHSALSKDYKTSISSQTLVIDGRNFFASSQGKGLLGVGRNMV